MRHNYWVDIYKIRGEILQLLEKHGIEYEETKEVPPNAYSNRIASNGAIAMICEDPYHPELPTSFCTPYGKLKIVGKNGSFYRNASKKKVNAFLGEMIDIFDIFPIKSKMDSEPHPAIAVTRIPWRASQQNIVLPIFERVYEKNPGEEAAKARRAYRRVLESRKKEQVK